MLPELMRHDNRSIILCCAALLLNCTDAAHRDERENVGVQRDSMASALSCSKPVAPVAGSMVANNPLPLDSFVGETKRAVAGVGGSETIESIMFRPDSSYARLLSLNGVVLDGAAADSMYFTHTQAKVELSRREGELYRALALFAGRLASEMPEQSTYSVLEHGDSVVLKLPDYFTLTFDCVNRSVRLRRIADLVGRSE